MTKQLRLNFVLTSFGKLFVAGAQAEGLLKVLTLNETTINKIKIGVVGKITIEADVNDNGQNPTSVEENFYCSEEHIFESTDLKDHGDEDAQVISFAVPLKRNLPPTIVAPEGNVTYQLYASMEEQFLDGTTQTVNTQTNISVTNLVDCNMIPKGKKEKVVKNEAMPSCFCITIQNPSDCLQINPRVYVPGDSIKINAIVRNATSYPMLFTQVSLVQKLKLKLDNRVVKSAREVVERKRGSLMPGAVQVWRDEYLRIPPVPPTTYNKHLQLTYELKFILMKQIAADGPLPKPVLSVPVFIGNLPLDETLSHFNQLPHGDIFGGNMLPIPQPYQEYARAENCVHPMEGSKFVPAYITYMTERAMENIELLDN